MQALCADLAAEQQELMALAEDLSAAQWSTPSDFYGWTAWDEVAHLCFFDRAGLLAATDAESFLADTRMLIVQVNQGQKISAIARAMYGHLDGAALLSHWRKVAAEMLAKLAALDAKARLPWYGPPMSARSFVTARLMETWAHGQDIWDCLGRRRQPAARLKHIAHLGVTTFKWSFNVHRKPLPPVVPYVELAAADGSLWTWGEPSEADFVKGSAEDFCLLVTQRRNLADTALRYQGAAAAQWLNIAQCFAGQPASAPPPGIRVTPQ